MRTAKAAARPSATSSLPPRPRVPPRKKARTGHADLPGADGARADRGRIFYPALREAIKQTDLLDEAEVEHASAKDLIAPIQDACEIDEKFDATVKVLGEYIDHHVKEA